MAGGLQLSMGSLCYYYVVHDNMRTAFGPPIYMSTDYELARDFFASYQPDWADAYDAGEIMAQLYEYAWNTMTGSVQLRLLEQKVR